MPAITTPGAPKTTPSTFRADYKSVIFRDGTWVVKPYMSMVPTHLHTTPSFFRQPSTGGGGTTPTGPTVPTTGQIWPRRG